MDVFSSPDLHHDSGNNPCGWPPWIVLAVEMQGCHRAPVMQYQLVVDLELHPADLALWQWLSFQR